ncbi:MAG: hypothetical protein OSJ68_01700 [Clostridia bacterium]|nr:hypothetical protein [Clostridia bacterium]
MGLGINNGLKRVGGIGVTAQIISTPPNVKVVNDSTIQLRIPSDLRLAYQDVCAQAGTDVSSDLREYIKSKVGIV